jgi:hypothetical protein
MKESQEEEVKQEGKVGEDTCRWCISCNTNPRRRKID